MNLGADLREARQRAGLSREDVSQRTKIQLAKIDALEANAFERLPEGVYLDGLVRAYATEVGLDGSEMVARLHRHNAIPLDDAIDRPDYADVLAPPAATPRPPSPAATPVPAADVPLERDLLANSTIVSSAPRPPSPISTPVPTAPPRRRGLDRMVLALVALMVAIGLGAYIYDRTRPFAVRDEIAAPAISHENSVANDAAATRGTPEPPTGDVIPADRPASTEHHTEESPRPSAAAPVGATADTTGAPSSEPLTAAAPPAADISGDWTLATFVESSSVRDYEGLQLGYQLNLQQNGSRISGEGMKTLENGREIAQFAQTPIIVSGTMDGGRLTLTFTERGRRRDSGGKMILALQEDGVLRGRFSSSAAKSSGTAEARRP
jgi:cytoskeletal protein RodZ